jgi:hypothetical protein
MLQDGTLFPSGACLPLAMAQKVKKFYNEQK